MRAATLGSQTHGSTAMETPTTEDWLAQCVRRLAEVDPQLAGDEAIALAQDLQKFERTAAMSPEAAVDFVVLEMARPGGRFERRVKPRNSA
jgi:hypothetical protein